MNILVADTDKAYRDIIENSQTQHNFLLADTGQDIIESFSLNLPPICIIDKKISNPGSYEVSSKIKEIAHEKNTNAYIIFTTDSAETFEIVRAIESGVDDFLSKPYDFGILEKRIHMAIQRLGLEDANLDGLGCPIETLMDEHEILSDLLELMIIFSKELNENTPLDLLSWFSSTAFIMTIKIHEEKEKYLTNLMIDKFMFTDENLFHEFASVHLTKIQDDHRQMIELLDKFKNQILE